MAFEDPTVEDIKYVDKPYFRQAYELALTQVRADRIREEDFKGVYDEEGLERDREYVAEKERVFAESNTNVDQEAKMAAIILEAIIPSQIELSNWMGEGVMTRQASRFDDIRNRVDMIAEIERSGSRKQLALAIDVTQGQASAVHKFATIKREINEDTLTTVKYFEDSDGNRGMLERCPRVVLGLDRDTIAELARLWVNNKKQELASHPAQLILLEETRVQLESFRDYARSLGKEDIASIYESDLQIILSIIKEKKTRETEKVVDIDKWRNRADRADRVAVSLSAHAKNIGKIAGTAEQIDEIDARYDRVERQAVRNLRQAL